MTCKNSGVYATKCECNEYYVGQPITSFTQRLNSKVLLEKYDFIELPLNSTTHITIPSKWNFKDAYSVAFVDTAANHADLDFLESGWIGYLQATININKTMLPLYS